MSGAAEAFTAGASGEAAGTFTTGAAASWVELAAAFPLQSDCTSEASAVAKDSPWAVDPSPCPLVELVGTFPSVGEVLQTYPSHAAGPCSFVVQLALRLLARLESTCP